MDKSLHYLLMATHSLFQKKVFSGLSDLGPGQPKILDYLGLHVYLTPLGWKKQREVMEVFQKCEEEICGGLSVPQTEMLKETLTALCRNMTDLEVLQ